MNISLDSELTGKVLSITREYGYTPEEIISVGITLATVLLYEKQLGNRVVVVAPEGAEVAEFKEVEPRAVREIAREYVQSICPEMGEVPPALLVAKLEQERDVERQQLN